jgi:hypothetical protein
MAHMIKNACSPAPNKVPMAHTVVAAAEPTKHNVINVTPIEASAQFKALDERSCLRGLYSGRRNSCSMVVNMPSQRVICNVVLHEPSQASFGVSHNCQNRLKLFMSFLRLDLLRVHKKHSKSALNPCKSCAPRAPASPRQPLWPCSP